MAASFRLTANRDTPVSHYSANGQRTMTDDNQIWVVDDDNSIRWVIEKALSGDNIACKTFETADNCSALSNTNPQSHH